MLYKVPTAGEGDLFGLATEIGGMELALALEFLLLEKEERAEGGGAL